MATTRPATPPGTARRLLLVDVVVLVLVLVLVGWDALDALAVDEVGECVVEPGSLGVGRVEVDDVVLGRAVAESVAVVVPAESEVAAGAEVRCRVEEVVVNGSSVLVPVDSSAESSAGTVTSGTSAADDAPPDNAGTALPVGPETPPDAAGDRPVADPQAASSTAAMP
jgi:hypothetical protein